MSFDSTLTRFRHFEWKIHELINYSLPNLKHQINFSSWFLLAHSFSLGAFVPSPPNRGICTTSWARPTTRRTNTPSESPGRTSNDETCRTRSLFSGSASSRASISSPTLKRGPHARYTVRLRDVRKTCRRTQQQWKAGEKCWGPVTRFQLTWPGNWTLQSSERHTHTQARTHTYTLSTF